MKTISLLKPCANLPRRCLKNEQSEVPGEEMDTEVEGVARDVAIDVYPDNSELHAEIERQLDSSQEQRPAEYFTPGDYIALAGFILPFVQFAWDIYKDKKNAS